MSAGWNYSDLSKMAKTNGGPEMLISKIKERSFQSGIAAGRKECIPVIMISVAITATVLVYEEGPKLVKKVKSRINKRAIVEEAVAAEKILIKEIREADSVDEDNTK